MISLKTNSGENTRVIYIIQSNIIQIISVLFNGKLISVILITIIRIIHIESRIIVLGLKEIPNIADHLQMINEKIPNITMTAIMRNNIRKKILLLYMIESEYKNIICFFKISNGFTFNLKTFDININLFISIVVM